MPLYKKINEKDKKIILIDYKNNWITLYQELNFLK